MLLNTYKQYSDRLLISFNQSGDDCFHCHGVKWRRQTKFVTGVRIHLSYCECHMSEKQKVFTLDMLNMDVENNRKMTFYVKKQC